MGEVGARWGYRWVRWGQNGAIYIGGWFNFYMRNLDITHHNPLQGKLPHMHATSQAPSLYSCHRLSPQL